MHRMRSTVLLAAQVAPRLGRGQILLGTLSWGAQAQVEIEGGAVKFRLLVDLI
jgi:hypothetical protein